ncbi:MAG: magnesium transporter, partial [Deferribacterales bacterium]|nr:magnesium transporter [Deferribacterales bacterium]
KLSEVMITDVVSVSATDTEDYVADLVEKYDLLALPVVDEQHRLCGIITVDDVIDIIKDKASEDIYTMAGVKQEEMMFDNQPFKVARIRLPWLLVTFIGELFAGFVITFFQGRLLNEFLIFATFMPIVMAMGGNVGSQAATIIIRSAALGKIDLSNVFKVVFKELRVGVIMGVVIGALLGLVAPILGADAKIGLILGTAIFFAMIFASFTGTFVPITLMKMKFDPAVASTPFITVLNDITGLTIYFAVSMTLLLIL